MSCFKLPKGLIKDLEVLTRKFWWGYGDGNRKVHWVHWKKLCQDKDMGGMGFKEIEKFNDASLAKQVWRMINNPNSRYLKQDFSLLARFWRRRIRTRGHMFGRVSLVQEM